MFIFPEACLGPRSILVKSFSTAVRVMADQVQPKGLFPNMKRGRAFYESIGSPRYIVAPMVDRSEFAWRILTRSYMDEEGSEKLLAYTPMLHARLFKEQAKFRDDHFQPTRQSLTTKDALPGERYLDGNPKIDRPLFVQFCANKPEDLLDAAQYVAPYCDAVDLNLGCPQGIAKSGRYGAFLQEDWDTIYKMINKLHNELSVPVTAKMRILETKEKTLDYAKMILSAGASILTVHGRRREQKGHNTGLADWDMIRYLRDNLPSETVLFANGNILNSGDLQKCLDATGVDGIMSAEGNLQDPTIFAKPPLDVNSREYWHGNHGKGGYRIDGVFRRYMDIIYKYILERDPPQRKPLFVPTDVDSDSSVEALVEVDEEGPPTKKRKKDSSAKASPNLKFMQGHLFQLLRPMVSIHTEIRDCLAKTRPGDIEGFEKVLSMVEAVTKKALRDEAEQRELEGGVEAEEEVALNEDKEGDKDMTPLQRTTAKYGRPWWICQPHIRPLPEEAIKIGAMTVSKKDKARHEAELEKKMQEAGAQVHTVDDNSNTQDRNDPTAEPSVSNELPKAALVCG